MVASEQIIEIASPESATALDALPMGSWAILGRPDRLTPTLLRLMEMGLTPGTHVSVTRRTVGGDPIEIRVRGTRLCLRRADAARFPVELLPAVARSTQSLSVESPA